MPRPVSGCDVRSLPLTPQDAFVLSRIDGSVTEADLSMMTGLGAEEIGATLDHLAELGAVTWEGLKPPEKRKPSGSHVAAKALEQMEGPAVETFSVPPVSDAGDRSRALYDPSELDEDVEITPEKRRRILDLYYQLEDLSFYELLGVGPSAEKKEIKTAYYQLAGEFHPDKHFRKRLGSFKTKMEAIFGRVTIAHDTLTKKALREDYDAYLTTQRSNRQLEASLRDGAMLSDAMAKELLDFVRAAGAPMPSSSSSTPAATASVPAKEPRPPTVPPTSASPGAYESVPVRTKEAEQARREALAARLGGSRLSKPPGAQSSKPPAPPEPTKSLPPEQAAEELKRRLMERQDTARRHQVNRYLEAATAASQRNDPAGAATAYRLALSISPDDPVLKEAFEAAEAAAATLLADGYLKQGAYEEKAERWKEAALSFIRAAEGMRDDAAVHHRVAVTMLRADMDLRRAAEYESRAIALDPKTARYRVTLAQIYVAAGMPNNARRELEAAAELAPEDATIAARLKAARKDS